VRQLTQQFLANDDERRSTTLNDDREGNDSIEAFGDLYTIKRAGKLCPSLRAAGSDASANLHGNLWHGLS
jgi:hypothetical protein